MQITLRLRFPEDADLILMRANEKRGFCSRILECISSYAEGSRYVYRFPEPGSTYAGLPQTEKVNILIREAKYPQAVSFLKKYEAAQRISLIKALLRSSYEKYPSGQVLSSLGFSGLDEKEPVSGQAPVPEETAPAAKEAVTVKTVQESQTGGQAVKEAVPEEKEKDISKKEPANAGRLPEKDVPVPVPSIKKAEPDNTESTDGSEAVLGEAPGMEKEKDRDLFEMFLNM